MSVAACDSGAHPDGLTAGGALRLEAIGRTEAHLDSEVEAGRALLQDTVRATQSLYERRGFQPPWIGYLAYEGAACVGACGFAGPAAQGEVEIAYFTFPGHEGRGLATWMARKLVELAEAEEATLECIAHTLPAGGASVRILQKLGFVCLGEVRHAEDGVVWKWKRARRRMARLERLIPILVCRDIEAEHAFLVGTLGFQSGGLHRDPSGRVVHGEVRAGEMVIWLHGVSPEHGLASPLACASSSAGLVVYVDDVDAHHAHARQQGGRPESEPEDRPYGQREYGIRDPEGHRWWIATRTPTTG